MPTGILPDNSLRVVHEGTFSDADWATVHYFTVPDGIAGPTSSELNTLLDSLITAFDTNLINKPEINNGVFHLRSKMKLLSGGSTLYRTVRPSTGRGTGSGASESAQVCYLIDWSTSDPRRGGKARSYLPGVMLTSMASNAQLTTAAITALTTSANAYHNAVNALAIQTHNLHFVEMSFRNAKADRPHGVGYEILSGSASNAVATQRRRVDRLRIS